MTLMQAILVAAVMILSVGTTFGEVVIREVPLRWEQVARKDGNEIFSNLCAVCHGAEGKGDGPAVSALEKAVPDLTALATNNDGVYPYEYVENVIFGKSRVIAHGTIDMPVWGEHFMYLRSGVRMIPRKSYAWELIDRLNKHVESIQVN